MSSNIDALIWIDDHEAKIFHLEADRVVRTLMRPHDFARPARRAADDGHFLECVMGAVAASRSIMLLGPGLSKIKFAGFIAARNHSLFARLIVSRQDRPAVGRIPVAIPPHVMSGAPNCIYKTRRFSTLEQPGVLPFLRQPRAFPL